MSSGDILNQLKVKLKNQLPGWNIQQKYLPENPIPGVEYTSSSNLRKGAVLACIYEDKGELMTILIERTKDTSPHSGQIAFPGGKYEEEDKNQVITALREANEEIGLNLERVEVLGNLSPVDIPVSGYTVLPVIAYHNGIPKLKANPHEVNTMIQTPLIPLITSLEKKVIHVRNHKVRTPVFNANGFVVWGATAMVLGELKEIIY